LNARASLTAVKRFVLTLLNFNAINKKVQHIGIFEGGNMVVTALRVLGVLFVAAGSAIMASTAIFAWDKVQGKSFLLLESWLITAALFFAWATYKNIVFYWARHLSGPIVCSLGL